MFVFVIFVRSRCARNLCTDTLTLQSVRFLLDLLLNVFTFYFSVSFSPSMFIRVKFLALLVTTSIFGTQLFHLNLDTTQSIFRDLCLPLWC